MTMRQGEDSIELLLNEQVLLRLTDVVACGTFIVPKLDTTCLQHTNLSYELDEEL
jgi:hypothetical protein